MSGECDICGVWGHTESYHDKKDETAIGGRVGAKVKPESEPKIEKIFEVNSHSNSKTREDKQIIVGESGTRIFIDWRKREFSISKDESKSV
jgi:hypothetical protein